MKTYVKIIVLLSVVLITLASVSVFIIYPALKEMKDIAKQIYSVRKDLEIKYEKGQNIKKTAQDIKEIEPKLPALNSVYIKENEEIKFVTALEQIAQAFSLNQELEIKFQNKTNNGRLNVVPINIVLTGDFIKTMQYLSSLEQLDYYINIKSLAVRREDAGKSTADGTAQITVKTIIAGEVYWQSKDSLN